MTHNNDVVWCVVDQGHPCGIFSTKKQAQQFWEVKDNEFRDEHGELVNDVVSPYELECWTLDQPGNRYDDRDKAVKLNPRVYCPGGRASPNAERVVLF